MDIETGAICAVLRGAESGTSLADAVAAGLAPELFDRGELVWRFIIEYGTEHGGAPPEHVVSKRFPDFGFPDERPAEVTYYIDELRKRRLHNLQAEAMREAAKAMKEKDPRAAFAIFEKLVADAQDDVRPARDVNIAATAETRWDRYREKKARDGVIGIRTPWDTLTEWTQGFQPGQFIVIAARTGVGKTWVLDKIAAALHLQGLVPLIDSREMSVAEMAGRIDAIRAHVPHAGLRGAELDEEDETTFHDSLKAFAEGPDFWIAGDDGGGGVSGLAAKIDRYKPAMVLLDGLYLVPDDKGETGWQGVKNVSNSLKKLARKKGLPILVSTQLNRSRGTSRNAGTDAVAYGDAISQDADVLITLYQNEDMRLNLEMDVILRKQRDGTTGEFRIRWDMATMDFSEVEGPGDDDAHGDDDQSDIPF